MRDVRTTALINNILYPSVVLIAGGAEDTGVAGKIILLRVRHVGERNRTSV